MKRSIIISFLLALAIIVTAQDAYSQINRTIYGLQIGKSTEYQTKSLLKSKGHKYKIMPDGSIAVVMDNMQYGGGYWSYMNFKFFKGVLYEIYFHNDSYHIPIDMDNMYTTIQSSLNNKYKQYRKPISPSGTIEKCQYFYDERTWVILTINNSQGQKYISLDYMDDQLNSKNKQSIEDEL